MCCKGQKPLTSGTDGKIQIQASGSRSLRRKVTFGSAQTNEGKQDDSDQALPLNELWYSKQEIISMKRRWQSLIRKIAERKSSSSVMSDLIHADIINEEVDYRNAPDFDDLDTLQEKRVRKRLYMKSVLKEQKLNRERGVQDPMAIAVVSTAYSSWARQQALVKAGTEPAAGKSTLFVKRIRSNGTI